MASRIKDEHIGERKFSKKYQMNMEIIKNGNYGNIIVKFEDEFEIETTYDAFKNDRVYNGNFEEHHIGEEKINKDGDLMRIIDYTKNYDNNREKYLGNLYETLGIGKDSQQFQQHLNVPHGKFGVYHNSNAWEVDRVKELKAESDKNFNKLLEEKYLNIPKVPVVKSKSNYIKDNVKATNEFIPSTKYTAEWDGKTSLGDKNKQIKDITNEYISKYGYLSKDASDDEKFNYYKRFLNVTNPEMSDEDIKKEYKKASSY